MKNVRNIIKESNKDRDVVKLIRNDNETRNKVYIGTDLGLKVKNGIITII